MWHGMFSVSEDPGMVCSSSEGGWNPVTYLIYSRIFAYVVVLAMYTYIRKSTAGKNALLPGNSIKISLHFLCISLFER